MLKNLKSRAVAVLVPMILLANEALAAVPTEVTTALTDAKSDGITIASAVFVAIVAIFAFALMRKALR